MLSARLLLAGSFLAVTALSAAPARADGAEPYDGELRRPQRLTVGVADDLLGQLSPDGKTLYFVSNRDTINQLFAQSLADGRASQLFDDDADVTWPRVSPDGRTLLYISYREQAAGQLCVRRLPDGEDRRCLSDGSASAALQGEWIDRGRIALVTRQSIKGDLRILEVTVGSSLSARPLMDRNLTSPTVSPDGRWLVYVPVERKVESVGPAFAAHAAPHLEAVPVASGASTPVRLALDLPGQTGQPAFARDGRSLYVVQFIADTNHDGAVDAGDHGVLYRIPLSFAAGAPVPGTPEQLTETSWNCEYPAPFVDRLIATCSQGGSLDVYALPLDGEVPTEWGTDKLQEEFDDADTRVEEQLLASRRLAKETTLVGRRLATLNLALVHLEREEYRAADFYAEHLRGLRDETSSGISLPLRLLVEQRRAVRRREQGRLMEGFAAQARERMDKLKVDKNESPMAEDLVHLVRSEVADSTGDKGAAKRELEAVTVDETTPQPIVEAYYLQADALFRELDDREGLIGVCRLLAADRGLKPDEQLRYARAATRAMVRGLPYDEAAARLARERPGAPAGSELAFAIDLARAVLAVRDARAPRSVSDALLALYAAQTRPGRRRALMLDAVQRADDVDADDVLDALVQRDIHDVKRGSRERPDAEQMYERMILGRAYESAAARQYDEARADFDAVADQTGSYEAVVGAIDIRLRKGERGADIEAAYETHGANARPPAMGHFAKAYLLARQLPRLEGEAHARAAAAAIAALDASWGELKEEPEAQALFGALLHEEYLQTGDLGTAERANLHYLVALELVAQNPRFRAMILGELGLLHTDVGNYRIALGYLLDRDKLPYMDDWEGLDVLVSKAQALLHVGRDGEAAKAADAALALIQREPSLGPYRLLALDWAAVSNLAAGRFARALQIYGQEIPLLDADRTAGAERNRLVVRLSRAAAAIGAGEAARALPDLDYVDARVGDPKLAEQLRWPHATAEHVVRAYRLIAAGLRASANRALGRLDAEARALETRLAILDERFEETSRLEIERDQMLAETQLATNAAARHDVPASGRWLGKAVAHAEDLRVRQNGVTDRDQLDVIWLAAVMTVSLKQTLVPDLPKRIEAASADLASRRDPALKTYSRWFEIYAPLVGPAAGAPPAPSR